MKLKKYLTDPAFVPDGLSDCLSFHDSTKFKPKSSLGNIIRISEYLNSDVGMQETALNYRALKSNSTDIGTAQIPADFNKLNQKRQSCRVFSRNAKFDRDALLGVLKACCDTRKNKLPQFDDLEMGFRGYPSGGGLFPVDIFVIERNVDEFDLRYLNPRNARLYDVKHFGKSWREKLQNAFCSGQGELLDSAMGLFVFVPVWERSIVKYNKMGYRFALMEVGMVSHHISLALTAADIQTLHWAGGYEDIIAELLDLDTRIESPCHILWYGIGDET